MGRAPHDTKNIATASEAGHVMCNTAVVRRFVDVGPQLNATDNVVVEPQKTRKVCSGSRGK